MKSTIVRGSLELFVLAVVGSSFLVLRSSAIAGQTPNREILMNPDHPEMNRRAPDVYKVALQTTKGAISLEVRREWSPHGADRFYNLVRHGYYDDAPFFRARPKTWIQFGISADPAISTIWRTRTIPDDPRELSNARGTVSYAFKDPNGRTTQMFINLADNAATHDPEPFVPFARVVRGMDVADALYDEHGERAGGGIRGGKQDTLFKEGNAFLRQHFPAIDYIIRATVLE
jgi:cyclophilin family peptidyl-prolyl cis-trans isomerase